MHWDKVLNVVFYKIIWPLAPTPTPPFRFWTFNECTTAVHPNILLLQQTQPAFITVQIVYFNKNWLLWTSYL